MTLLDTRRPVPGPPPAPRALPEPAASTWRETRCAIGQRIIEAIGAEEFVHDDPNGLLRFRVGPHSALRMMVVTYRADDTYTVEMGLLERRTFAWTRECFRRDVTRADLAAVVLEMAPRARR
jgi:hypothetical protein